MPLRLMDAETKVVASTLDLLQSERLGVDLLRIKSEAAARQISPLGETL